MVDWNLIATGLVGIAGIMGTAWGASRQIKSARRENELAYRRALYRETLSALTGSVESRAWNRSRVKKGDVQNVPDLLRNITECKSLLAAIELLGNDNMTRKVSELDPAWTEYMFSFTDIEEQGTVGYERVFELMGELSSLMTMDLARLARA